jgi:hypothetical protein
MGVPLPPRVQIDAAKTTFKREKEGCKGDRGQKETYHCDGREVTSRIEEG